MATAADIVAKAKTQIGVKESPAGSNRTKYGKWYGMNGQPWCAMFVSWVANECGELDAVGGKFAYCPYWVNHFKKKGQWLDRSAKPQPGDIIFFSNGSRACHVGIVTERVGTDYVRTIEGNTSASGSQDNGGAVLAKKRAYGRKGSSWYILGFGRPNYSGAPKPTPKPLPKQPSSKPINATGCYYRAHVERAGWLSPVHDGMAAGTTGYAARLEAIKLSPPKGVIVDVDVHIQKDGWKTYKGVEKGKYDPVIGTTGKSKRLEAIRIRVVKNTTGKTLKYRAHIQGEGWQSWKADGQTAGTTGKSLRLEAVQIAFT